MGDHSIKDRSSNRLPGYDYAQPGACFITIGSYHRKPIFGQISNRVLVPSPAGTIVGEEWFRSGQIRDEIELDAFVLMPNHLHGIVWLTGAPHPVGATGRSPLRSEVRPRGPAKRSLGAFIAGFKSITTRRINQVRNSPGAPVWQRNYYDHIIRSEADLNRCRGYILRNPLRWEEDQYYFSK